MNAIRSGLIVSLAVSLCCGCANTQLRISTVRQARTLTDLQYAQVLDNLAMFALDMDAVPWLITLKSGSTQVSDTGAASLTLAFQEAVAAIITPNLNVSRAIVDQWGTAPVTDDNTLRLLRMAYQTAHGRPRLLSEEEANDLGHDLSQQIGTNADISTDADTLRAVVSILGGGTTRTALADVEQPPKKDSDSAGNRPGVEQTTPIRAYQQQFQTDAVRVLGAYNAVKDNITSTLDDGFLVIDPAHQDIPLFKLKGEASTGLAKETERRVNNIQNALAAIPTGWFHIGRKRDIPCDACYVGHYKSCGCECYVWVEPEGRADLAEFTLTVLNLASVFQDSQILTVPTGIQFSPALSRPSR